MIAVNSNVIMRQTKKICCPECRSRICDVVVPERGKCRHKYRIAFDGDSDCLIAIKCQKCGKVIGLGITK